MRLSISAEKGRRVAEKLQEIEKVLEEKGWAVQPLRHRGDRGEIGQTKNVVFYSHFDHATHSACCRALNLEKPSFVEIASGLLWAVNELLKEGVRGVEVRGLVHTFATLTQDTFQNPKIRGNKEFCDIIEETLRSSKRMAEEWHRQKDYHFQRSYLEDSIVLSRFLRHEEESKAIWASIAGSYIDDAEARSASKISQQLFYGKALEICANQGLPEKVEDLKRLISQCEREAEEKGEYSTFVAKTDFPFEFAKDYVEKLRGPPEVILQAMVEDGKLIPSKDRVLKRAARMTDKHPLLSITPIQLMGRDGPIESFNTQAEILDYKAREQYNLEAQLQEAAITVIFEMLLESRLHLADISNFILRSRNVSDNMRKIIERGLKAHFDQNYVCAVSVLTPQIEELLRNLLRNHGIQPTKYDQRKCGIGQTLLGTLIDEIEQIVGEDFAEYLRIRLTTEFGNIRNKVCHGWMQLEEFSESLSTALIFIILKLSKT